MDRRRRKKIHGNFRSSNGHHLRSFRVSQFLHKAQLPQLHQRSFDSGFFVEGMMESEELSEKTGWAVDESLSSVYFLNLMHPIHFFSGFATPFSLLHGIYIPHKWVYNWDKRTYPTYIGVIGYFHAIPTGFPVCCPILRVTWFTVQCNKAAPMDLVSDRLLHQRCARVEGGWGVMSWQRLSGWWFQRFFIFILTWGNDAKLTYIFQMGWNHQLVISWRDFFCFRRIISFFWRDFVGVDLSKNHLIFFGCEDFGVFFPPMVGWSEE